MKTLKTLQGKPDEAKKDKWQLLGLEDGWETMGEPLRPAQSLTASGRALTGQASRLHEPRLDLISHQGDNDHPLYGPRKAVQHTCCRSTDRQKGDPPMPDMGYGYGSECHLLRYMGRHRQLLNRRVLDALDVDGTVLWLDLGFAPNSAWPDAEWEGLSFLEDPEVLAAWQAFWPQTGKQPTWDAVGRVHRPGGHELLLVEAKAHLAELGSRCGAQSDRSLALIRSALDQTKQHLGVAQSADWLNGFYQQANRLAVLCFLHTHGVAARLMHIYFTGDRSGPGRKCPPTEEAWAPALDAQAEHLGLAGLRHPLLSRVHKLFLPVCDPALKPPDVRKVLADAWISGVNGDYRAGALYYEEDAQSSLYHHLRKRSGGYLSVHVNALKHRRELERLSPDIVVCSADGIEALIEVKYFPWNTLDSLGYKCIEDAAKLQRLQVLLDKQAPHTLRIDPESGQAAGSFRVHDGTIYAVAVIGQGTEADLDRLCSQLVAAAPTPPALDVFSGLVENGHGPRFSHRRLVRA